MQLQIFIPTSITKEKKKVAILYFVKIFYKTITFEWSQELSAYTGLTAYLKDSP